MLFIALFAVGSQNVSLLYSTLPIIVLDITLFTIIQRFKLPAAFFLLSVILLYSFYELSYYNQKVDYTFVLHPSLCERDNFVLQFIWSLPQNVRSVGSVLRTLWLLKSTCGLFQLLAENCLK